MPRSLQAVVSRKARFGIAKRVPAAVRKAVNQAVDRGIVAMHKTAATLMTNSPASGNTYAGGGRIAPHKASAPGEAPAVDSGLLRASLVIVSLKSAKPSDPAVFAARAAYAKALEYGTSKMAARPFMAPSFDDNIGTVRKAIEVAVRRGIKDSEGPAT